MIVLENVTIDKNAIIYRGWKIFHDSLEGAWCAEKTFNNDLYGKSIEDCCNKVNEIEDKNVKI